MGRQVIDTSDYETLIGHLDTYIQDVELNRDSMLRAATDCSDNLGNDKLSMEAIGQLQEALKSLGNSLEQARELKQKVRKKIEEIRETHL